MSPRKVSKNHSIFVSPLKGNRQATIPQYVTIIVYLSVIIGVNQSSMSPLAKTFVVCKSPASVMTSFSFEVFVHVTLLLYLHV